MAESTKEGVYHTSAFNAAGAAMMSFKPINAIHQYLCGFHFYATDHTRHVEAHHFCTHVNPDLHQCVIYDSDKPDARLIGIEYILSEDAFLRLPMEEHKYWHSHKYEVESGMLRLVTKGLVPEIATDSAEQPAMLALQKTYGKTIHTWQPDLYPDVPLGPPSLMMAYTSDRQLDRDPELAKLRNSEGVQSKRALRKSYLPVYEKTHEADQWERDGRALSLDPVMKSIKFQ